MIKKINKKLNSYSSLTNKQWKKERKLRKNVMIQFRKIKLFQIEMAQTKKNKYRKLEG